MISRFPHNKIDRWKWDHCIESAVNSRIYGYSWFLDIVCPGWEALVEDDYKSVFPLTHNSKLGIKYLYQPFFTQQLGVFSEEKVTEEKVLQFLRSIPEEFRFTDIQLNSDNPLNDSKNVVIRRNYELNLSEGYNNISLKFNQNTKRNLKKSERFSLTVSDDIKPDEIIDLFKNNFGRKERKLSEEDYGRLMAIMRESFIRKCGNLYGVRENGYLHAAMFILSDKKRYIFHFAASSEEGKKKGAMFILIDWFLRMKGGEKMIMDFEGSDDENVARLYSGFGATDVNYPRLIINKLPWFIKPVVELKRKINA